MPTPTSSRERPLTSPHSRRRSRLNVSASIGASKKSKRAACRSYRFWVSFVVSGSPFISPHILPHSMASRQYP